MIIAFEVAYPSLSKSASISTFVDAAANESTNIVTHLSLSDDLALREKFGDIYKKLGENEEKINKELNSNQGESIEIGGYYHPNVNLAESAMRPSDTFNKIINSI